MKELIARRGRDRDARADRVKEGGTEHGKTHWLAVANLFEWQILRDGEKNEGLRRGWRAYPRDGKLGLEGFMPSATGVSRAARGPRGILGNTTRRTKREGRRHHA